MRRPTGGKSGAREGVAVIVLIDFSADQVGFKRMVADLSGNVRNTNRLGTHRVFFSAK